MDTDIEELLERPYWLIDIVPERIEAEKGKEYALLQEYCRSSMDLIRSRFISFLLKLNCYRDLKISWDYGKSFKPLNVLPEIRVPGEIYVLIDGRSLLTYDTEDTSMTLYCPDEKLLETAGKLALSEGFFLWKN